ncbi:hypothetical protein C1H76_0098 [Elsinoe australis]|uniref:F-box domain-containing protein n=1 Tax=Elsinoe australis TaxID=40998 RepID=A0A4V6DVG0_9PEZI|nr:hypothetical protein C1H76_0098 [Elsinoe australis]
MQRNQYDYVPPIPQDQAKSQLAAIRAKNKIATRDANFTSLTYPKPNLRDNTPDQGAIPKFRLRLEAEPQKPNYDCGLLDRLPVELLHSTLYHLDVQSLMSLAETNRRGTEIVRSLPHVAALAGRAPTLLRSIRALRTGAFFSLHRLAECMTSYKCEVCDDFGAYLYLLTCKRLCRRCFNADKRFHPLLRKGIEDNVNIPIGILKSLPHATSFKGEYLPSRRIVESMEIFDLNALWSAGILEYGSETELMGAIIDHFNNVAKENYAQSLRSRRPTKNPYLFDLSRNSSSDVQRLLQESGSPRDYYYVRSWLAVVQAPVFNSELNEVDHGRYCKACKGHSRFPVDGSRRFNEQTFRKHLEDCGPIRMGVHPEYNYALRRDAKEV